MEIIVNGEAREISSACLLSELLEAMELNARPVAVEVNREVVPRAEHENCVLQPGDELEIVTLVGGG